MPLFTGCTLPTPCSGMTVAGGRRHDGTRPLTAVLVISPISASRGSPAGPVSPHRAVPGVPHEDAEHVYRLVHARRREPHSHRRRFGRFRQALPTPAHPRTDGAFTQTGRRRRVRGLRRHRRPLRGRDRRTARRSRPHSARRAARGPVRRRPHRPHRAALHAVGIAWRSGRERPRKVEKGSVAETGARPCVHAGPAASDGSGRIGRRPRRRGGTRPFPALRRAGRKADGRRRDHAADFPPFPTAGTAGLIVVAEGGRTAEAGGHAALLRRGGPHAEPHTLRARRLPMSVAGTGPWCVRGKCDVVSGCPAKRYSSSVSGKRDTQPERWRKPPAE